MPTVTRTPTRVNLRQYTRVENLTDPADGEPIDAYTEFRVDIRNIRADEVSPGRFAIVEPLTIEVRPLGKIRPGTTITSALRDHEQLHYDVGFATARALASHAMRIRENSPDALRRAQNLHCVTRAGLIQQRYDKDSRHGTNAHYQNVWAQRIRACIANPSATKLGGYFL